VLASQHQALRRMAAALGDGAQVLLYGCSIASGPAGRRFLEYLEDVLGGPVAAAEGPVGDPAAGGGWVLSRRGGGSVAEQAFRETVWVDYPGLLDTVTLTDGPDNVSLANLDDIIIADVEGALGSDDTIDGGDGNDTLSISAAQDVILGDSTLVNVEVVRI